MITTLKDLRTRHAKAPILSRAIDLMITQYGDDQPAMIIDGKTSYRPNSNCGSVNPLYVYPGPKRRYASEGYRNVVILHREKGAN